MREQRFYVHAMAKKLQFTEDSRVKIPVILQLVRLGYTYMPEKEWKQQREPQTNILREVFAEAYVRLNADKTKEDALSSPVNTFTYPFNR